MKNVFSLIVYLIWNPTFIQHQIFATLSSNTPRATGNIRCITCAKDENESNHGHHNNTNEAMTTNPLPNKRQKQFDLKKINLIFL